MVSAELLDTLYHWMSGRSTWFVVQVGLWSEEFCLKWEFEKCELYLVEGLVRLLRNLGCSYGERFGICFSILLLVSIRVNLHLCIKIKY